jgi:heat shock protein HtpX
VGHRDILIGSIAAVIAGAINMLYYISWFTGGDDDSPNPLMGLAVVMVAGLAASMVQLAISRSREFEADAGAARLIGSGQPLARALQKLDLAAARIPMNANPATAHMFIMSPLAGGGGRGSLVSRLFRTHPSTEERLQRLLGS